MIESWRWRPVGNWDHAGQEVFGEAVNKPAVVDFAPRPRAIGRAGKSFADAPPPRTSAVFAP